SMVLVTSLTLSMDVTDAVNPSIKLSNVDINSYGPAIINVPLGISTIELNGNADLLSYQNIGITYTGTSNDGTGCRLDIRRTDATRADQHSVTFYNSGVFDFTGDTNPGVVNVTVCHNTDGTQPINVVVD